MKKKIWIWFLAGVLLLAILFIPIPTGVYKDGGTREYTALTYKIVDWNRLTGDTVYDKTKIYFFPYNFKSINGLWYYEKDQVENKFIATVLELDATSALVEPVEGQEELRSSNRFVIGLDRLDDIGAEVGSVVEIFYTGEIMESSPAQVNAVNWEIAKDLRHMAFTESWLDKETAQRPDYNIFSDIVITEIYSNCFFARTVIPMPYEIKLNGTLSDWWCVGDQVTAVYDHVYYDEESCRVEADFSSISASDFELDPNMAYKPVIYLYPEREMEVRVNLTLDGRLTCTYPSYNDGWAVIAAPDGTLTDAKGQTYNYLYWEGTANTQWDLSQGFCVRGEETALFLEDSLAKLGLNRREANEFIVYWLPLMQENPYNIISFQTEAYTDVARLDVEPVPDTLIRVFMTWSASDSYVDLPAQELSAPARMGFTVVEWGGAEVVE